MKSWSIQYFPSKKKVQTCTYTDYSHNSIITQPGTWLDTYWSAYSHKVWTLSTQHSNSQYADFYTTLGLGHTFVSAQHTVTILTRNVIYLHLQREAPNKSVGFLLKLCSQLGTHYPNHTLHMKIEPSKFPDALYILSMLLTVALSELRNSYFYMHQYNHLISIKASVSWNHVSWNRWESNCSHARQPENTKNIKFTVTISWKEVFSQLHFTLKTLHSKNSAPNWLSVTNQM